MHHFRQLIQERWQQSSKDNKLAEEIVRCSINHPATYPIVMNNKVKSQFKVPGPTTQYSEKYQINQYY